MRTLGCVLLLLGTAWGQGGVVNDIAIRSTGEPASGATVKVCRYDATPGEGSTASTVCTPAAKIYTDPALTSAEADSILTADAQGNYKYYAVPGYYIEQVCISGSCLARKVNVGPDGARVMEIRLARYFPGGSVTAQLDACLADSATVHCMVPSSMSPGAPTSTPAAGKMLWDLRNGGVILTGRGGSTQTLDGQKTLINWRTDFSPVGTAQQAAQMCSFLTDNLAVLARATEYRICDVVYMKQGIGSTDDMEGRNTAMQSTLGQPEVDVLGHEYTINNNQADDANLCSENCHTGVTVTNTGAFINALGVGVFGQWRRAFAVGAGAIPSGNSAFWYGGNGSSGVARLRSDGTWQLGFESNGLGNPNELQIANNKSIQGLNAAGTNLVAIASVNTSDQISIDPGAAGAVFGGNAVPSATGQDLGSSGRRWDLFAATANVGTSLTINGGTAITKHLSATASLDFDFSGAGITEQELTIRVQGAAPGDVVSLGLPTALQASGLMCSGFVSSSHTVTVRCMDVTSRGTNPAAATVRADVWQH